MPEGKTMRGACHCGAVKFESLLILLERVGVIAAFVKHQPEIITRRSFEFLVVDSRSNIDRLIQILNGVWVVGLLPVDQSQLIVSVTFLIAVSQLFFHLQCLFRKLQRLIKIAELALAVGYVPESYGLVTAVSVRAEDG